jgi:RNA polymerase sigma factor (sigma-70 family)
VHGAVRLSTLQNIKALSGGEGLTFHRLKTLADGSDDPHETIRQDIIGKASSLLLSPNAPPIPEHRGADSPPLAPKAKRKRKLPRAKPDAPRSAPRTPEHSAPGVSLEESDDHFEDMRFVRRARSAEEEEHGNEATPPLRERTLQERANVILELPLDFVENAEFEQADRDESVRAVVLGPMPNADAPHKAGRAPPGLPPYLASLYDVPLLTREQERHLFRKMNYLKSRAYAARKTLDAASPAASTIEEIEELYHRMLKTRNAIVRANLRLVVSVAKKYAHSSEQIFELISDGNMSLLRAVEKFDYGRGFKFSTYASWAIMKNFSRTIPSELRHQARQRTTPPDILDPLVGSTNDTTVNVDATDLKRRQTSVMDRMLQALDERECEIILLRYGLDTTEPQTLKQIGALMGITKERVRQLQTRAMSKMRLVANTEHVSFDSLFPNAPELQGSDARRRA